MNKLFLYTVRDSLAGDSSLVLTAKNDEILKRSVKGLLLSQQQNFINTDTKDKDIYLSAELDTDTGKIVGFEVPSFICNVEQLRIELVSEIRRKREEAGLDGTSETEQNKD